jgi:hypothetical protein
MCRGVGSLDEVLVMKKKLLHLSHAYCRQKVCASICMMYYQYDMCM